MAYLGDGLTWILSLPLQFTALVLETRYRTRCFQRLLLQIAQALLQLFLEPLQRIFDHLRLRYPIYRHNRNQT